MAQNRTHLASSNGRVPRIKDWDDIRLFLILAKTGSVRQASIEASLSRTAIIRRIEGLESRLGRPLFARSKTGMSLTPDGQRILSYAAEMNAQAQALADVMLVRHQGLRERVRVSVTEGLGTFWLVPRALDFMEQERSIGLNIQCDVSPPQLDRLDIDCAVMLDKPSGDDIVVQRLGWLHICIFASKGYVQKNGAPQTMADISKHPFVNQVANQLPVGVFERESGQDIRQLAALPSYAMVLSREFVHVAQDFAFRRDVWLACHSRALEHLHVRKTLDWLKRAFDPDRYPWFGERFIPPGELPTDEGLDGTFSHFRTMPTRTT